jgi:hypothetical protein
VGDAANLKGRLKADRAKLGYSDVQARALSSSSWNIIIIMNGGWERGGGAHLKDRLELFDLVVDLVRPEGTEGQMHGVNALSQHSSMAGHVWREYRR